MIRTILRVGWLNLKRDKVALVLTFVLPIIFFSIFAFIFGGMSGGGGMPEVELVVVDEDQSEVSKRFVRAIQNEQGFKGLERNDRQPAIVETPDRARGLVEERECDAALIIPKGFGESFGSYDSDSPAIILYCDDVANPVAHQIVTGLLQKIAMTAMPDLAIERGIGMFEKYAGTLTQQQRDSMQRFLPLLRGSADTQSNLSEDAKTQASTPAADSTGESGPPGGFMNPVRVEIQNVQSGNEKERKAGMSYYAAGIGVMFLLFSMAGAMGAILQEASTGTLERLLSSRLGMTQLLLGNWLFAALMGFVQLTVMFIWGWAVFGVELWTPAHLIGFIVMSAISAAAASAFGLMLGTACRSQGQLQGISTVVILCMSAIGGSMIPRFILKQSQFMDIAGLFTFNGWALDGYQKVFWYDKPVWALWPQLAALGAMAVAFLFLARMFAPMGVGMNIDPCDRRTFLAAAAAGASMTSVGFSSAGAQAKPQAAANEHKRPVVISSSNGLRTVEKAMAMIHEGHDPLDAVVAGINIVEDDPSDNSVGYGGLPNENGVVELDASVMHGPSHKAGAVAALQNVKNPSSVALQVLRRTDHVLLVGAGALEFARAHGFEETNLLTKESREAWLKWKENLNRDDDWLDKDQRIAPPTSQPQRQSRANQLKIPYTTGTIHCAAVNEAGDISACTSTSGLSYKLPGRVGDSPIIGAGMYVDNAVGAAGATGRGEAVIQSCGAFAVVRHMADGVDPTEACLKVLKWIADHNRQDYLRNENGEPNFGVTLYALRKDGAYGSATMRGQKDRPNANQFAMHDGTSARLIDCVALFNT